jgi:acyl-CoA dehydrogenase
MLDEMSPHAAATYAKLSSFCLGPCLAAEKPFADFMAGRHGADRWTALPPVLLELQAAARSLGLWNLFSPHESGLTVREYGLMSELMGRAYLAAYATNCAAPDSGNMEVLHDFGSEEQKRRWLGPLMGGRIRSAFLMTEPQVASSDATNVCTTFTRFDCPERKVPCYRVRGVKWWSTGASDPRCSSGGCFIVLGQVAVPGKPPPEGRRHDSHTMLVIPADAEGVERVRALTVFQHDDAPFGHAEVALNDVVVPVSEALIANEGDGFAIAQARLGPGRIHHCMRAIGLGRRCHELMVERSLVRTAFGKPLLRHGMTQEKVADSLAALECARAITLVCADKIDKVGAKNARDSIAMIKYKVPELVLKIIDDAIQVHGAAGVSEDTCLAQAYSYMRTLRIADGPDEVHKMTVARIESKRAIGRLKAKL